MRGGRLGLIAGAVILIAVPVAWFLWAFEPVERTVEVGPQGPARVNRYLAAERYLTARGLPTTSSMAVGKLPDLHTAIVWLAGPGRDEDRLKALEVWVRRGGHLIWVPDRLAMDDEQRKNLPPWLSSSFTPEEARRDLQKLQQKKAELAQPATATDLAAAATPSSVPGWRHRKMDAGLLTLALLPTWFDNKHIGHGDHAAQLWALLEGERSPKHALFVVWPHAPSLLDLIWRHGWPTIVALFILLLAWARRASRRFGPPLAGPSATRRSLLEHVVASGRLLWRLGHRQQLLDRSRSLLLRDLGARLPAVLDLPADERDAAIAAAMEEPLAGVQLALQPPNPLNGRTFVEAMKAIDSLRRKG